MRVRTRAVIPLSLPVAAGEEIARAAVIRGLALSTFIREAAVAEARRVIEEQDQRPPRRATG